MAMPRQSTDRFWSKIDKRDPDLCWEWISGRNAAGYGQARQDARPILAHRRAFVLAVGEIPADMFVCHRCDNPPCCNPAHLFLGTAKDNMQDKVKKKRFRPQDGEKNYASVLSHEQVHEIRQAALFGVEQKDIARLFGVGQANVSRIITCKMWAA